MKTGVRFHGRLPEYAKEGIYFLLKRKTIRITDAQRSRDT
jgi:hypothetical protein